MNALENIDKLALRELLTRNWITHDAMWLMHAAQAVGMEATNTINRQAARSMGAIEIRRIQKLIGLDAVRTVTDLERLCLEAFELIRGSFMVFDVAFQEPGTIVWTTDQCFAHKGMTRAGLIGSYECGIIERIYGWLDGLGLEFAADPDTTDCLMHTTGRCQRSISVDLARAAS